MILFNYKNELHHYSDKFNSNNILNDINKIEILEKNDYYMKPYLIKNNTDDYNYDIDQMYEDLDKIYLNKTGDSIKCIHNMGCDIKVSECELLRGSQYNFENILKIFYNSKVINVIKNKDEKCFICCYIRKYLNPVNKHGERVSIFVKIKDLNKIENLLETNVHAYSCNKNFQNKFPIYKSDKNYEKYLDLLLFENHYMNIKRIDLFF